MPIGSLVNYHNSPSANLDLDKTGSLLESLVVAVAFGR